MKELCIGSQGMGYSFAKEFIEYIFELTYPNTNIISKNTDKCDVIIFTHFTWGEERFNYGVKPFIIWNGESIKRFGLILNKLPKNKYSKILLFSSVEKYENLESYFSVPYGW